MIELAVCAGVMVSCLAGVFQFGYTFYVYNQLVTAVGNGGRYAAMRTYREATASDLEKGRAAIQNMVVYGDTRPTVLNPVVANLRTDQVQWNGEGRQRRADLGAGGDPQLSCEHGFQSISLDGRPGAEFPYLGRYAPGEVEP